MSSYIATPSSSIPSLPLPPLSAEQLSVMNVVLKGERNVFLTGKAGILTTKAINSNYCIFRNWEDVSDISYGNRAHFTWERGQYLCTFYIPTSYIGCCYRFYWDCGSTNRGGHTPQLSWNRCSCFVSCKEFCYHTMTRIIYSDFKKMWEEENKKRYEVDCLSTNN